VGNNHGVWIVARSIQTLVREALARREQITYSGYLVLEPVIQVFLA